MDHIISPMLLYLILGMGAVGVYLALPRRVVNPQVIGGLVAGMAGGLVILLLTVGALSKGEGLPNLFFYVFSVIALGASLRVITHPRPVYAALYFILTILASSGLYLILSAEFMAFALVIVYAGAILITYLFVIMLATQTPNPGESDSLTEYDTTSREPIMATAAGFVLLGVLTTVLFAGTGQIAPAGAERTEAEMREVLPGRFAQAGATEDATLPADATSAGAEAIRTEAAVTEATNVERVGVNLLADYPGSIEIAGVILLMAMLGAVVLARKKIMADEEEKASQAKRLDAGGTR